MMLMVGLAGHRLYQGAEKCNHHNGLLSRILDEPDAKSIEQTVVSLTRLGHNMSSKHATSFQIHWFFSYLTWCTSHASSAPRLGLKPTNLVVSVLIKGALHTLLCAWRCVWLF